MSTSVYWSPLEKHSLCGGCGRVADALEKAFGKFPITLDYHAQDRLRGMAATWSESGENPYEALANAIVEFDTIEVSAAS